VSTGLCASHPRLAAQFEEDWDSPLGEYGKRLFQSEPLSLDPDFLGLVQNQARQIGYPEDWIDRLCRQLCKSPVIQTSHHSTPTHGPTFTAIDLITLSGLDTEAIYPIFATSGVPFSNSAWSGALSYGSLGLDQLFATGSPALTKATKAQAEREAHGGQEARLSLIGAKWRDHLVFSADQSESLAPLLNQLHPNVQPLLAPVRLGQPWSHWAAKTASLIQGKLFGKKVMVLDMSVLVADYVALKLKQGDPLFLELLSDPVSQGTLDFLVPYRGKKSFKVNRASWDGGRLCCEKAGPTVEGVEGLAAALAARELCPAVWTSFFVLRFVLGLKCLGSFNQVGYLENFRLQLLDSKLTPHLQLDAQVDDLTTGRLFGPDGKPVWPLDQVLSGQQLSVDNFKDCRMSTFWEPVVRQLKSALSGR